MDNIRPPFFGKKITEADISDIEGLVDLKTLFLARWQYKKEDEDAAKKAYERMMAIVRRDVLIEPKIVYGYFECRRIGNGLVIEDGKKSAKIDFPRERKSPNRCISDWFCDGFLTMQLVTIGSKIKDKVAALFSQNKYQDTFLLKGLASEFTEALAKFSHRKILTELGVPNEVGERCSPGYPSFPNLLSQRAIVKFLDTAEVGVSLTKTCMLIPEHTTSAIISIDEKAARFIP